MLSIQITRGIIDCQFLFYYVKDYDLLVALYWRYCRAHPLYTIGYLTTINSIFVYLLSRYFYFHVTVQFAIIPVSTRLFSSSYTSSSSEYSYNIVLPENMILYGLTDYIITCYRYHIRGLFYAINAEKV